MQESVLRPLFTNGTQEILTFLAYDVTIQYGPRSDIHCQYWNLQCTSRIYYRFAVLAMNIGTQSWSRRLVMLCFIVAKYAGIYIYTYGRKIFEISI